MCFFFFGLDLVCKECILTKIREEELECCPVCNIFLGADPFTKMRLVFHKIFCWSLLYYLIWYGFMLPNMNELCYSNLKYCISMRFINYFHMLNYCFIDSYVFIDKKIWSMYIDEFVRCWILIINDNNIY
jgi:ABC-type long-subunit fatty acid transport system fused permease/ATPase subunit